MVVPGRAFLRRLIDLTKGIRCASHFIRLSRSVKADLRIWGSFLDDFNGRWFFLGDFWSNSVNLNLYTDSAASLGFGAIFGQFWCFGEWPEHWKHLNIVIWNLSHCFECAPMGSFDAKSAYYFLHRQCSIGRDY